MGRPKVPIDEEALLELLNRGATKGELATQFGVTPLTLSRRIADIQQKQGLLLQYRAIQSLQLTELQSRCLEAITPEKIEEAPLRDLIFAFKVLKDKELTLDGKPSDIKGLVGYLIALEKEEIAATEPVLDITPAAEGQGSKVFDQDYSDEDEVDEDEDLLH